MKALLSANRLSDAEPLVWQLFKAESLPPAGGRRPDRTVGRTRSRMRKRLRWRASWSNSNKHGRPPRFVAMMQDVVAKHRGSPDLLEFMSELFNVLESGRRLLPDSAQAFDLHCGMGSYAKAAECLDRAADVDAYEPGHQKRLEMLRGKIDDKPFQGHRLALHQHGEDGLEPAKTEGPTLGAAALQDLMLQAEILVQYGMRTKAIERLQRIRELFPREEERNQDSAAVVPGCRHDSTSLPTPVRHAATPELRSSASKAPAVCAIAARPSAA